MQINSTLEKFEYPNLLIKEYKSWVILLRQAQITLGSAIISSKSFETSFANIRPDEMAELPIVIKDYEEALRAAFFAEKFNYLALMMVDPNPHFHAIPRYSKNQEYRGLVFEDRTFPKPPQLDITNPCRRDILEALCSDLRKRLAY